MNRHPTHTVRIGQVSMGGSAPVVVQSMTNTDTADVSSTTAQIIELADAGSEIVRMTVNTPEAAAAVPYIREGLEAAGYGHVPLVGDFHYNGHQLLTQFPECAKALDKYRINPGNVGFKAKKDPQFTTMVECAMQYGKPVRIGVNWGSLDQELLSKLMDANVASANPLPAQEIMRKAVIESALQSAARAEELGLGHDRIVLSCKVSTVQDLVAIYTELASRSRYALHLGLTEAGMGSKGIVASSAALGILLQQGIGDTIRISITPEPGQSRTTEVKVARQLLQSMDIRSFAPMVTSCPGCGRTTSDVFQHLAMDVQAFLDTEVNRWRTQYPGVENLKVAVMGCVVNGPGESRHADIGISLPGTGEEPAAAVFINGEKAHTLRGPTLTDEFKTIVSNYVAQRFGV